MNKFNRLHTVNDLFTEQTLWTEKQKDKGENIGKPDFNAATDIGP
jgi:hypothetical protein